MTMFSQKAPFDLTEFLGKPATPEARRLRASLRRKHWLPGVQAEGNALVPPASPSKAPKAGGKGE